MVDSYGTIGFIGEVGGNAEAVDSFAIAGFIDEDGGSGEIVCRVFAMGGFIGEDFGIGDNVFIGETFGGFKFDADALINGFRGEGGVNESVGVCAGDIVLSYELPIGPIMCGDSVVIAVGPYEFLIGDANPLFRVTELALFSIGLDSVT